MKRGKKGAKTSVRTGAPQTNEAKISMGSQMNIETEGRLRYKILTNFVNAYKDKMFLSNSPGKAGDGGGADIMTLEDLKAHTQAERSDIKLDFEQFMRIFSFEKNRSTNVPQKILSATAKD